MGKSKTGKPALPAGRYFKYAIGEIILVVIGILKDMKTMSQAITAFYNIESAKMLKQNTVCTSLKKTGTAI